MKPLMPKKVKKKLPINLGKTLPYTYEISITFFSLRNPKPSGFTFSKTATESVKVDKPAWRGCMPSFWHTIFHFLPMKNPVLVRP